MKLKSKVLRVFLAVAGILGAALAGCAGSEDDREMSAAITAVYELTTYDKAEVPADGAEVIDLTRDDIKDALGIVYITAGGDYVLTGEMKGQIRIQAEDDEVVHLFLDHAAVRSVNGPAIYGAALSKLIITSMDGTENTLADSPRYDRDGGTEANADACVYSVSDITFNGQGMINIYGFHKHAVRSKDRIKIAGGAVSIKSKKDGIYGNDGVLISGDELNIQCEGHGIRTGNSAKNNKGYVEITDGSINITAKKYGIYAVSDVHILGGSCSFYSIEGNIKTDGEVFAAEGCVNE